MLLYCSSRSLDYFTSRPQKFCFWWSFDGTKSPEVIFCPMRLQGGSFLNTNSSPSKPYHFKWERQVHTPKDDTGKGPQKQTGHTEPKNVFTHPKWFPWLSFFFFFFFFFISRFVDWSPRLDNTKKNERRA